MTSLSAFEQLGGQATLKRVHKIFYDKLYAHPWTRQFFQHIKQEIIENQQTDFITGTLGGPRVYCGRLPIPTHKNMLITEELFDLRHAMLEESLIEAGVPRDLRAQWLKIDKAFRSQLVKNSVSECERRFPGDDIMAFPNPGATR